MKKEERLNKMKGLEKVLFKCAVESAIKGDRDIMINHYYEAEGARMMLLIEEGNEPWEEEEVERSSNFLNSLLKLERRNEK